MMFCGECGTKNDINNRFCEKCGKNLDEERAMLQNLEKKKEVQPVKEEPKKEVVKEEVEVTEEFDTEEEIKDTNYAFSKRKYSKYIRRYENSITSTYALWIGFGVVCSVIFLAYALNAMENEAAAIVLAFLPPLIGWMIARTLTFAKKVRIQEMKWKLDFYQKYID